MPTNRQILKEKVATYASVLWTAHTKQAVKTPCSRSATRPKRILRIARSNMDLSDALEDSSYTPEQRGQLVRNLFASAIPSSSTFWPSWPSARTSRLLSRVWASYGEQLERKLNVTVVDVTTVVELDDHLREVITKKAEADLGTNVVLREHIDKSLLGGILMSANGKRIDASVLSQLESARNVLKLSTDGGEC